MGSGSKKQKKSLMGTYTNTDRQGEAWRWCIKNNIKIVPQPKSRGNPEEWHILIDINNKKNLSPETYKAGEIWQKLYEYCEYYYDKYRKRI
jgi:hypothetical protein